MSFKKTHLIVICILLIYAAIIFPRLNLDNELFGDGPTYYLRALALHQGLGYVALDIAPQQTELFNESGGQAFITKSEKTAGQPLLPVLLSIPMSIFGDDISVAKLTMLLLQFGSMLLIFFAVRFFFSRFKSFLIILLFALNPIILQRFPHINSDILFFSASVFLFSLLWRNYGKEKGSALSWLGLGALFGSLVWLRYGAIGWTFAGCVWLFVMALVTRDRDGWRKFMLFSIGAGVVIILLLAMWSVLRPGYIGWFLNAHAGDKGINPSEAQMSGVLSWVKTLLINGITYIRMIFTSVILHVGGFAGIALSIGFVVLFVFGLFRFNLATMLLFIVFIILSRLPYLFSTNPTVRYMLPYLFLLVVPVLKGAEYIGRRYLSNYTRMLSHKNIEYVILTLGVIWYTGLSLGTTLDCYRIGSGAIFSPGRLEFQQACIELQKHYPEGTILASRKLDVGRIYSGFAGIPTPSNEDQYESFNSQIANYKNVLILRDDDFEITKNVLDPWIDEYRQYLVEVVSFNNTRVYEVDIPAFKDFINSVKLD